jgi:ribosome-binding ATPase YchF (GTP1/OBG family)
MSQLRRLRELGVQPADAWSWAVSFSNKAARRKGRAHPDAAAVKQRPWLADIRDLLKADAAAEAAAAATTTTTAGKQATIEASFKRAAEEETQRAVSAQQRRLR